jgi:hypothetical protein
MSKPVEKQEAANAGEQNIVDDGASALVQIEAG